MRSPITTSSILATAVLALTLGACSGDDTESGTTDTVAPTSTAPAVDATLVPPGPSMIVDVETAPGSRLGAESGDDDTTTDSCAGLDGRWDAGGTVTNPTESAADYRVYVTFMDGSRIVALVESAIDAVAPGATQEWTAGFEGTMSGLTCITRVEREPA